MPLQNQHIAGYGTNEVLSCMSRIKCSWDGLLCADKYPACSAVAAASASVLRAAVPWWRCPCDKAGSWLRSCLRQTLAAFFFPRLIFGTSAATREGITLNACGCGGTVAAPI